MYENQSHRAVTNAVESVPKIKAWHAVRAADVHIGMRVLFYNSEHEITDREFDADGTPWYELTNVETGETTKAPKR